MAFDLPISISDNSPLGQAVQRIITDEHLTAEQAVTRILDAGSERLAIPVSRFPSTEVVRLVFWRG